ATGWVLLVKGLIGQESGDYRLLLEMCDRAEAVFRDSDAGGGFERPMARLYGLIALVYLGGLAEASRRAPLLLRDARERGDRHVGMIVRLFPVYPDLAADDLARAEQSIADWRRLIETWPRQGGDLLLYDGVIAQVNIDLYRGDALTAWRHFTEALPALDH